MLYPVKQNIRRLISAFHSDVHDCICAVLCC
jgi:hypothetical protein